MEGTDWMKPGLWQRRGILILFFFLILCVSCQKEENKKSVSFEICGETELPDEVRALIEKKKESPFHFTYKNSVHLYLAVGYGAHPEGEYVAAVRELYETDRGIFADTVLIGISYGEGKKTGDPSACPYVVIRCEKSEKPVFFL